MDVKAVKFFFTFLCFRFCRTLNITVQPSVVGYGCSLENFGRTVLCGTLEEAVAFSLNLTVDATTVDPPDIQLPRGTHFVTGQTNFGGRSILVQGLREEVELVCSYYADPDGYDSSKIHTWLFNQSGYVSIKNINFQGCGFPLSFFAVRNVDLQNCQFVEFKEAVLDIFNCHHVLLNSVHLHNNSGNGRLLESNRGNTGGIALGYDTLPADYTNPTLTLSNSIFTNNEANGFLNPEKAVTGNVYLGRGGGVGLFMNERIQDININITNCTFLRNRARLFGGGLYILTTSYVTVQHRAFISGCHFVGNMARSGGSGVQLSFLGFGDVHRPHSFAFTDCHFIQNQSPSGGGIYIFVSRDGNYVKIDHCNFTENTGPGTQNDFGAAIALTYLGLFSQRIASTRHEIIDSVFIRNKGPNGIFNVGYAPIVLSGKNKFVENVGASLRVIGSLVKLKGELEFYKNHVDGEGALHLLSFGQIQLSAGTLVTFEDNTGRLGSCIVVDSLASLDAFSDILFNPRCFINYENGFITPSAWSNVSVTFNANRAVVSSAVYLSQTSNECSWYKNIQPFFNRSFLPDWPLWSYNDNNNTGHQDFQNQELSFGSTATQLFSDTATVRAWPGKRLTLSLRATDSFKHRTSTNARFIFKPNEGIDRNSVIIQPQIAVFSEDANIGVLRENYEFHYVVNTPAALQQGNLGWVVTEEAFNEHPVIANTFALHALPCPGGYQLNLQSRLLECKCVQYIEEIIFCNDDQDSVILKHGTWAVFIPVNDSIDSSVNLFFHPCPAGYCRCSFESSLVSNTSAIKVCSYQYRNSDPDFQCICSREGVLCGKCRSSNGVTVLLNKCTTCSSGYLALIPALVLLVVLVVLAIIFVDKPLPAPVLPILFYIQTAPYAAQLFPESFEVVGNYLYYISNAVGLYFVYDFCLSSHLSATYAYFLRYLPMLVTCFTYGLVWLFWRKIFKKKSLQNHGSWWLTLLLYSPLMHTSFSILNCPSIAVNGSMESRWLMNGEEKCFTGEHIALGLLAVGMTVTGILFTFAVSVLPYTKLNFSKHYTYPFMAHYKTGFKFWSGVELARRLFFLLALASFPRNSVVALLVVLVSLSLHTYFFPYKSMAANILDVMFQMNLLVLLLLEAMPQIQQNLFVFPIHTEEKSCNNNFSEVSSIVYVLGPVYYFPLVVTATTLLFYLLHSLVRYKIKKSREDQVVVAAENITATTLNHTSQVLSMDYYSAELD